MGKETLGGWDGLSRGASFAGRPAGAGWEERARRAAETACGKARRLRSVGQVGKPASKCVPRASSSRGPDSGRKARGNEGGGLAWRGFCALQGHL